MVADAETAVLCSLEGEGRIADQNCFGYNFYFIADTDTEKYYFGIISAMISDKRYACFNRSGNKGAFRLPGATWDHFRCMVEPSPGHIWCRVVWGASRIHANSDDLPWEKKQKSIMIRVFRPFVQILMNFCLVSQGMSSEFAMHPAKKSPFFFVERIFLTAEKGAGRPHKSKENRKRKR